MGYEAGERVWYQPRGKGTRRKQAIIKEARDDDCYLAVCEGKFYHISEEHIVGTIKRRKK